VVDLHGWLLASGGRVNKAIRDSRGFFLKGNFMDYLIYALAAISLGKALFAAPVPKGMGLWRLAPYVQMGCALVAILEASFVPLVVGFVVNNILAAYMIRKWGKGE
jgi:hypothetical protein